MSKANEKNNIKLKILNISLIVLPIMIVIVILFLILLANYNPKEDKFVLIGNDITLKYKEEYTELGCKYIDKNDIDLSKEVQITNNINSKVPGTYKVLYRYNDKILIRNVTILEPDSYDLTINYDISNKELTNQDINITYNIVGDAFNMVELPDGTTNNNLEGSFIVKDNGTYTIKAYNDKKEVFQEDIVIDNIDHEKPTGTCDATITYENTQISVIGNDNNSIVKYEYYANNKLINTSEVSKYTMQYSDINNILVKLYDQAGNSNDIKCNIIDLKYRDPIKPSPIDNIVFQEETKTLDVYITRHSGYYLTRIWAKNPYQQLNKAASREYGVNLYTSKVLLEDAIVKNNLQNKLIIGFNASGFYLKNTYDVYSISRYPAYDRTEVGSIVINNGVVFRNAYDKAVKQWYITGINKENKMVIYEDNVATTPAEINAKREWSNLVINSGIRNTFNFAGPVILNGKVVDKFSNSMPDPSNTTSKGLQLICQINENNFVLYTSGSSTRKYAINKLLELGCQTATNLDGGGSVALLHKSKNASSFTTIIGGGRELPATAYFTE